MSHTSVTPVNAGLQTLQSDVLTTPLRRRPLSPAELERRARGKRFRHAVVVYLPARRLPWVVRWKERSDRATGCVHVHRSLAFETQAAAQRFADTATARLASQAGAP